jgi:hypothetical protein
MCRAVLTVSEDELRETGKIHGNASKEVIVAAQPSQTLGRDSTLEAAKGENGRRVWDQEPDQTEQCRIS